MAATQVTGESSVISPTDVPFNTPGEFNRLEKGKKQQAEYDLDQCIAAMKGEKAPSALSSFWHRRAVIRGIRNSLQFATDPTIIELCSGDDSQAHQFSRARNARLIMSGIIPNMQDPATEPYCIWYPELATEETYRELAHRYPSMRYQVGRACAAALYTDLYGELDLLPDISIAEEARDVDEDADIYNIIMSAPQRWAVMDDFTRSVNLESPQTPAFMNGNMKPRRALGQRALPPKNLPDTTADDIDIEEDGFIGLENIDLVDRDASLGPGDSEQLWMPLPPDLPVLKKCLLAQVAAWEGNVDRYARLMHPRWLRTETEYNCILRGIYHHTTFARWWAYQLETNHGRIILSNKLLSEGNERECREIRTAINARKIMNNEISGIEDDSDCLPWLIWWPVRPHENTCNELARKCPSMRHQIAITCIICDYQLLFVTLKPFPRESLFVAAKQSGNPFYLKYLEEFVRERSIGRREIKEFTEDTAAEASLMPDLEPRNTFAHSSIRASDMIVPWGAYPRGEWDTPGIYGGLPVQAGVVERYMWLSIETAQKIKDDCWASSGIYDGSADTGLLHIDDDDSENELWLKLARPPKRMTSFEMKEDGNSIY